MNRALAIIVVAAGTCLALSAFADLGQYVEDLHKSETGADPEHMVRDPIQGVLKANCNINDALRAGLTGESKNFSNSLEAAENQLKSVAEHLMPVAGKAIFNKIVIKNHRPIFLPSGPIPIRTGNDILRAIATLAQRSADAIDRIRSGHAGDEDFAEIVRNSAVITRLITQFYGISS